MLFDFKDIKDVYSYNFSTFLIKNDGTLWATGSNEYSRLGLGQVDTYYAFRLEQTMPNAKHIECGAYHIL